MDFHFLRPWWWLALIPFLLLVFVINKQSFRLQAWERICDSHLLHYMMAQGKHQPGNHLIRFIAPFASLFFIILALTGPTWSKLPTPVYHPGKVQVFVLDLSQSMLRNDIKPDRLARARFILTDLLNKKTQGQFGMIAYTAEPFIVSPLTEDPHAIESLLPVLAPDIMPLEGQNLALALKEAEQLIQTAGFQQGNILVLTANPPTNSALALAQTLARKKIYTSIIPLTADNPPNPLFSQLAQAGGGQLLSYALSSTDLKNWPLENARQRLQINKEKTIDIWQDEGRWFLIPALLFLLPVFRKGWLQRVRP